ncbi:MAG: hypothetical protein JXB60_01860 [Candidatus Cloacimonetes bacterium]|nr:hypothetical protein [Candidatus Cloacimonadota bacterium]
MNIVFRKKPALSLLILLLLVSAICSAQPKPPVAFLKSAILPGWGELSCGNKSGYVFLAMEFILWGSHLYCLQEEELLKSKSFDHAIKYAHINPHNDYEDSYFYHLSKYSSSGFEPGGYNFHILQEAEQKYPNDPIKRQEYIQNNIYSEEYFWDWDSDELRVTYGKTRKDVANFSDYAKAATGTIVVNHIISAINSLRVSSRLRRTDVSIYFDTRMDPNLKISYKF